MNKNQNDICSICIDASELKRKCTLRCQHVFHTECLAEWFLVNTTCPVCRSANMICCHYQFQESLNAYYAAHELSCWAERKVLLTIFDQKTKLLELLRQNIIMWREIFPSVPYFTIYIEEINEHSNDVESLLHHKLWLEDKMEKSTMINQSLRDICNMNMITMMVIYYE